MNFKLSMEITAAAILLCGNPVQALTGESRYPVGKSWVPLTISGRDWWPIMGFYPVPTDPKKITAKNAAAQAKFAKQWMEVGIPMRDEVREAIRKFIPEEEMQPKLMPEFLDTAIQAYMGFGVSADRSKDDPRKFYLRFNVLPEYELSRSKNVPIFINTHNLTLGNFQKWLTAANGELLVKPEEMKKYEEWKKSHPNFAGFICHLEWGNNNRNLKPAWFEGRWKYALKNKLVKPEQYAESKAAFEKHWPNELKTRRDYIERRLKVSFDDSVKSAFGDKSKAIFLEGQYNVNHLAAYWGAGMIIMETSRHNIRWQSQLMFNRGAARQFNIPWCWYVAGFLSGYTKAGAKQIDTSPSDGIGGISESATRRAFYMTYLSGANFMESEMALWTPMRMRKAGIPIELTKEGWRYVELYHFAKKHPDRGVPYTPIALLVNYDRGSSRAGGWAFWRYPLTHADSMLDAFFAWILDWPFDPAIAVHSRKGTEYALAHNPYGDIFDALTPDFPDQTTFKRVLPDYPVSILLGEYPENPELAKILMDYVLNGGTLLINVKHLNKCFPTEFSGVVPTGETTAFDGFTIEKAELKAAEVLEKDKSGNPILTLNHYGKGRVFTALQHYMTSWNPKIKYKFRKQLPLIDKVLRRFSAETLPVRVDGEIQFGLNKTKTGWWLYLINNKGIRKFTDTNEIIDPAQTRTVKVSWPGLKVDQATELITGKKLDIVNSGLTVEIMPGDIKILELQ